MALRKKSKTAQIGPYDVGIMFVRGSGSFKEVLNPARAQKSRKWPQSKILRYGSAEALDVAH